MSAQPISRDAYTRALLLPDLTDSAYGGHAMQLVVRAALQGAWGCPVLVHRASPVVSIADNYERLQVAPDAALGIRRGQHNLLVRVVLRHPTRTLTSEQANLLRDHVHAAIHEGTARGSPSPLRGPLRGEGKNEPVSAYRDRRAPDRPRAPGPPAGPARR